MDLEQEGVYTPGAYEALEGTLLLYVQLVMRFDGVRFAPCPDLELQD